MTDFTNDTFEVVKDFGSNWSKKNPDSGDFYRNRFNNKNFHNDGGVKNTRKYHNYRQQFYDNSRYRVNRGKDRNNSWNNQKYNNSENPRNYQSRWDNPYSNYSNSNQSFSYADDHFDQAKNARNKDKTDNEFTQYNVSTGVRNSPSNVRKTPTKNRASSVSKEEPPNTNNNFSKNNKSPGNKGRNDSSYDKNDKSKDLRPIKFQSDKNETKTPDTSKSPRKKLNVNPKQDRPKNSDKVGKKLEEKSSSSSKEPIRSDATVENLDSGTTNKAATSPVRPKITLIPLAKLIRNELLDLAANDILASASSEINPTNTNSLSPPATSDLSVRTFPSPKQNLVPRQRNISCCSNSSQTDTLVEKVVNMDKSGIKNVINSTGTKYDEALQIQARKRLREEIRKKLKSMNLEKPSNNTESIDSVADDIVNSIDLPQTVMDEIRKAFGIELDDGVLADSNQTSAVQAKPVEAAKSTAPAEPAAMQSVMPVTARRVSSDLMSRIKAAEQLRSFAEKSPPKDYQRSITQFDDDDISNTVSAVNNSKLTQKKSKSQKPHSEKDSQHKKTETLAEAASKDKSKKRQKKSKIKSKKSATDVIVIESSDSSESSTSNSSSSSSSSSSSDDTDSDSSTSAKSSSSSVRRRLQKQKIISENVVNSFETLILPNLSEAQRDRYKDKYSATTSIKLHFISCICTSEYNTKKFSKMETAKLQRNLKAEDKASALEFLMREIVNVFNKQKKLRQEKEKSSQNASEKDTGRDEETNELMKTQNETPTTTTTTATSDIIEQPANRISASLTSSSASARQKEAIKSKNANTAESITDRGNLKEILLKRQLQSVNEQTSIKQGAAPATKSVVENIADMAKSSKQRIIGNAKRKTQSALVIAGDKENPIRRMDVNDDQEKEPNVQNKSKNKEKSSIESENISDLSDEEASMQNLGNSESAGNNTQKEVTSSSSLQSEQRQWKSPTEKKSIDHYNTTIVASATTTTSAHSPGFLQEYKGALQTSSSYSGLEHLTGFGGYSNLATTFDSFSQQPNFLQPIDLDALKHNNLVGEAVVGNLREIDVKLMELHKRKMFIEEMILKLQKEKMEADMLTIKLQNEKFLMLNTAMTAKATAAAASACTMSSASPTGSVVEKPSSSTHEIVFETESSKDCGTNTESTIVVKKIPDKRRVSPSTSALSDRLRNRKKRCQQDIRSESTEKVCQLNEVSQVSPETKRKTPAAKRKYTTRSNRKCDSATEELPSTTTATSSKPVEKTLETDTADDHLRPTSCLTEVAQKVCSTRNPCVDDSLASRYDYTNVPTGNLDGIKSPVTQILVFEESIIASSEDGNLYKFNIRTLQLEKHFPKHSEAITQMNLCPLKKVLYTTSLDGYLKKSSIENFDLDILTVYLEEPLQSIDVQWGTAFIGSRWGNIFTYDLTTNHLAEALLCSSDASVIALKATKEGPRKILIVSSKGNLIHFRDAISGLLLRSLSVPENLNIFSLLLDIGCLYCGTQKNVIYKFDFTTGGRQDTMYCGNGAVSMKLYKGKFLFVGCYDGFVYVLDKESGCQIGRFPGSGKLVLALEIAGDKLLTSAKDNTMQVIDIPKYIVAKAKV